MDCGDAGHILLSKRVADDLAQYRRWQPYLHELGNFGVKHGVVVSVVNLYAEMLGNPEPPARFKQIKKETISSPGRGRRSPIFLALLVIGLLLFTLAVLGIIFVPAILHQTHSRAAVTPAPAASATPSALPTSEKSIAVLPFENLSSDKDNAFFADGVQDEILTDLAKIADLRVISRTSVMQYRTGTTRDLREIGKRLSVAHLLEGSVQRAGGKVRVNAQLIDARNDAHLWAKTYDRDLADVFSIQSEIAKKIADQLQARISPREKAAIEMQPTKDFAAYDLYVRATETIDVAPNGQNGSADLLERLVCSNRQSRATRHSSTLIASSPAHTTSCICLAATIRRPALPWLSKQLTPRSAYSPIRLKRTSLWQPIFIANSIPRVHGERSK